MGYTHYWSFKTVRGAKGTAAQSEKKYQNAIKKCAKVIRYYSETFGGLSGYTAHDKTGQYGGIKMNGSDRVGQCEDFIMREHLSENEASFCKTRQYPYDTVVVACLIILKQSLGDSIEVGSDGYASDWADGLVLAQKVTGLKLSIPVSIETKQSRLALVSNRT